MQAVTTSETIDFITHKSDASYESEISYDKSDISSYQSDTDYEESNTYNDAAFDDDEFSTNESFQSEDSYDSDEEKEKQSLLKRLKATYNPQSFIRGFITMKLTEKGFNAKSGLDAKNRIENSQLLKDNKQNDSLVEKKKKRVRKNKLQVEKSTGDTEISTEKATSKKQSSSSGKYAITPQRPIPICEMCFKPLYSKTNQLPLFYQGNCFTWFHKDCVAAHVRASINEGNILVKCPLKGCDALLEIKKIVQVLNKSEFHAYAKKAKALGIDVNLDKFLFCTTPGCDYLFEIPPHDPTNWDPKLDCPSCKKSTCANCKVAFHRNLNCVEYRSYTEEDYAACMMLEELQRKRCVKCRFWIEQISGGNHVICRCSYQFCYKCSAPWKTCVH